MRKIPSNQSELLDLIDDVEGAINDDITIQRDSLKVMLELIKSIQLGGRPPRKTSWAIYLHGRQRKEQLKAEGKSAKKAGEEAAGELKRDFPEHFRNRKLSAIEQDLKHPYRSRSRRG